MKKKMIAVMAIVCALICAAAACTPKEEDIVQKFGERDYACKQLTSEDAQAYFAEEGAHVSGIKTAYLAAKGDDALVIALFESSGAAKEAFGALGGDENAALKKKGECLILALGASTAGLEVL